MVRKAHTICQRQPSPFSINPSRPTNNNVRSHDLFIESICQHNTPLEPSAAWKYAKLGADYTTRLCVANKYEVLYKNPSTDIIETHIMRNCHHNDVVGLSNRYLKQTTNSFTADEILIGKILDELSDKLKPHFNGPCTLREFMSEKKGNLRKRYNDAATKVMKNGFDLNKHSKIGAFIKNEIYNEIKPPRMIMGRDPRFNLIYGLFTTQLEHAMTNLPEISKGRNFLARGEQFFNKIYGAWTLECDFSKYEATQRLALLQLVELGLWRRLSTPFYPTLENIFKSKMRKHGRTLNDITFEFFACRGSGDMDTGLFNTLLTWVACRYFEIKNQIGNCNFICDGDDNLVQLPVNAPYVNTFAEFGFDAKLILRTDYHDIDYCSGKFVQYKPGQFTYVQNLNKLMANLPIFRKTKFRHCIGTYYYSLGFMYKKLYGNLPVYSAISKFLMSFSSRKHVSVDMLNEINPSHTESFKNTSDPDIIDCDINTSFIEISMCFNHPLTELQRLTHWYNNNTIILTPDEDKRYNCSKTPATLLSLTELDMVEQILYHSCSNFTPTKKLATVLSKAQNDR